MLYNRGRWGRRGRECVFSTEENYPCWMFMPIISFHGLIPAGPTWFHLVLPLPGPLYQYCTATQIFLDQDLEIPGPGLLLVLHIYILDAAAGNKTGGDSFDFLSEFLSLFTTIKARNKKRWVHISSHQFTHFLPKQATEETEKQNFNFKHQQLSFIHFLTNNNNSKCGKCYSSSAEHDPSTKSFMLRDLYFFIFIPELVKQELFCRTLIFTLIVPMKFIWVK